MHIIRGGYTVMQVYCSGLALEDNSGIGEAVRADLVYPVSALVPSSTQPKKQTHNSQWVLLGEDLVISSTYEVGFAGRINCERAWNGPKIPLHSFSAQPWCPRAKLLHDS